jgi:hypothetical protein
MAVCANAARVIAAGGVSHVVVDKSNVIAITCTARSSIFEVE